MCFFTHRIIFNKAKEGKTSKMGNNNQDTVIGMLGKITDNPMQFFRSVAEICVEPEKGFYGSAWHTEFKFDSPDTVTLPASHIFMGKFVFIKGEAGGMNSFILANGPLNHSIPAGITAAINPKKIEMPKDGHIRFQASAPNTDKLVGYLNHNNDTLILDPAKLTGMSPDDFAKDIQMVYSPNYRKYIMHIHTDKGCVYSGYISHSDIARGIKPEMAKIESGANTLLTIPRNNEVILILGTDGGIVIGGTFLDTTKGQRVTSIIIDSEDNMIIYRTPDKIFAIRFDNNLRTIGAPMLVSDAPGTFTRMMSGRALEQGKRKSIILTTMETTPDKKFHIFNHKIIGFQPTI